ncbi:MAG: hypothetical protein AB1938_19045 [Myxococcota bacterium]
MNFVRAVLNFVVGGALLGVLLTTLVAPRVMTWDNTPSMGKALCDCAETTRQTATRLVNAQLMGTGVGAAIGLIAGIAFSVVRRKKGSDAPAAPTA